MLSEAQRLAREVALAELGGKQAFWTGLDEIPQEMIVGYMDVASLCRTDIAMTGVEEKVPISMARMSMATLLFSMLLPRV